MKSGYQKIQRKTHELLSVAGDAPGSRLVDLILTVLIVASIVAVTIETLPGMPRAFYSTLLWLERLFALVFLIEYALRVWSITASRQYAHPFWGRLRYMGTFFALIDLLAILPFYLPIIAGGQFLALRTLRLLRLFRLLKLARYIKALHLLGLVVREKRGELVVSLTMLLFVLFMASSFMYVLEHEAQPDKFSSIPHTMWWSVATLTTVGYGDVFPVTPLGKFLGAIIAITGVGLFALPAGILASGFSDLVDKLDDEPEQQIHPRTEGGASQANEAPEWKFCPNCGKPLR